MLNNVVVVGRLVRKAEENGLFTLAVPRSFKNENGEYETDFIKCRAFNSVAQNLQEYCEAGDLIGVKGRLQAGNKNEVMIVIAEKITFLSSKNRG